MQHNGFSRTALSAAGRRAAHQILEQGRIFADPLAVPILGAEAEAALDRERAEPARRGLRLFVAARARLADEMARRAIADGVRQIVVLGAGLDTLAYRLTTIDGLTVFEVDHPATQREKRRRLEAARIAEPAHARYVPCDFERATAAEALSARGFDPTRRAVFSWLGVVPYLTEAAIMATLAWIASLPGGAEVMFDYANPHESVADPARRAAMEALAHNVRAAGEPLQTFFESEALRTKLFALGFTTVEDYGLAELAPRFFPSWKPSSAAAGPHVIRAAT